MIIKAKPPNVRNGIAWYPIAKQFSLDVLRDVCMKTVAWNMEYLLSNENQSDWFRCEFDFIYDLLSTSNLVVSNEYRLYLFLTDWLRTRSIESQRISHACELLPLIRFSQMLPIQLHQIEQSTFYQCNNNEQIRQLLERLLYQAYRFHTLAPLKRDSDKPEFLPIDWYLPREYTEMNITYVLILFYQTYMYSSIIFQLEIVWIFNRHFDLVFKLMSKHVHHRCHRLIEQPIGKLSIENEVMINGH